MSESSPYSTYASDDETIVWGTRDSSSNNENDDDLSDELTLLNGDEDSDEDSEAFGPLIDLSMRLKKKYNLREASVTLERCDKIWDTMQLLKKMQMSGRSKGGTGNSTTNPTTGANSTMGLVSSNTTNNDYVKYQPVQGVGNKALPNFCLAVKSQKKVHVCITCGKHYGERRTLKEHSLQEHGIDIPMLRRRKRKSESEPAPQIPSSVEPKSQSGEDTAHREGDVPDEVVPYSCPLCSKLITWKVALKKHALTVHGVDISEHVKNLPKNRNDMIKAMSKRKSQESKSQEPKSASETASTSSIAQPGVPFTYLARPRQECKTKKNYYVYKCIPCDEEFNLKCKLRVHAYNVHNISTTLPATQAADEHRVTADGEPYYNISAVMRNKRMAEQKESDSTIRLNPNRPGPRSSKIENRPKRKCALNTASYAEWTKDDELALQRQFEPSAPKIPSPSTSQTSKCVLCKNSYADIERHLRDYHRIRSPESVLPLTKIVNSEKIVKKEEKRVSDHIRNFEGERSTVIKKIPPINDDNNRPSRNAYIVINRENSEKYQCVVCRYEYGNLAALQRHLRQVSIDGVVQQHLPYGCKRKRSGKVWKDVEEKVSQPATDPLAISDESLRPGDTSSDSGHANARKRRPSSSDESSSTDASTYLKKRKFVDAPRPKTPAVAPKQPGQSPGTERQSVIRLPMNDNCYTEDNEEDKTVNQRDTRHSSDRDSGIGINITIKKRNNSYEVVADKDNYCKDNKRNKHCETVNDVLSILKSDPTANLMCTDFDLNGKSVARSRENFDVLDSRPLGNGRTTTVINSVNINTDRPVEDDVDDEIAIIAETHLTKSYSNNTFDWKKGTLKSEAGSATPGSMRPRHT